MYRRDKDDVDGPYLVDVMEVVYGHKHPDGKFDYHRLDGPALIDVFGYKAWYINHKCINGKIHTWAHENDIDLDNLTDMDKALIKIMFG